MPLPPLTNRIVRAIYMQAIPDDEAEFDPDAFAERTAVAFMEQLEALGATEEELLTVQVARNPNALDPAMDEAATIAGQRLQAMARRRRRTRSS